ncbi:MAG: hypothetical protein HQL45_02540 [Alphaproteobacteria bacterium]|nr:hypothetical protein [Alphaproteobacteria bacterium]
MGTLIKIVGLTWLRLLPLMLLVFWMGLLIYLRLPNKWWALHVVTMSVCFFPAMLASGCAMYRVNVLQFIDLLRRDHKRLLRFIAAYVLISILLFLALEGPGFLIQKALAVGSPEIRQIFAVLVFVGASSGTPQLVLFLLIFPFLAVTLRFAFVLPRTLAGGSLSFGSAWAEAGGQMKSALGLFLILFVMLRVLPAVTLASGPSSLWFYPVKALYFWISFIPYGFKTAPLVLDGLLVVGMAGAFGAAYAKSVSLPEPVEVKVFGRGALLRRNWFAIGLVFLIGAVLFTPIFRDTYFGYALRLLIKADMEIDGKPVDVFIEQICQTRRIDDGQALIVSGASDNYSRIGEKGVAVIPTEQMCRFVSRQASLTGKVNFSLGQVPPFPWPMLLADNAEQPQRIEYFPAKVSFEAKGSGVRLGKGAVFLSDEPTAPPLPPNRIYASNSFILNLPGRGFNTFSLPKYSGYYAYEFGPDVLADVPGFAQFVEKVEVARLIDLPSELENKLPKRTNFRVGYPEGKLVEFGREGLPVPWDAGEKRFVTEKAGILLLTPEEQRRSSSLVVDGQDISLPWIEADDVIHMRKKEHWYIWRPATKSLLLVSVIVFRWTSVPG